MKSMVSMTVLALVAAAAARTFADGWAVFDGGWRISAGAVYDIGVKADARVAPRQGYASPYRAGLSKSAAEAKAGGTRTSDTRTDFESGAWIDTDDPGVSQGEDYGKTWFYKFPRATWNGSQTFSLGSADYSEVNTTIPADGTFDRSFSDESGMLGVNIELSRNLYHDEDWGWGVDAAIGFTYFKHNGLLGIGTQWFNGSSAHGYGRRSSAMHLDSGEYCEDNWSPDGSYYGSGGVKAGPGRYVSKDDPEEDVYSAPISADVDFDGESFSESNASYGSLRADGDYENMELLLLARPYYDVTEWLRVNATLGLVVSRQDLDFEMSILRDGVREYSSSRDFSQWDVYGVGGLGLMLYYNDFTLSADFLARFLDQDLDFEDRYIKGEVSRGTWMFKLALGYEF